MNHVPAFCHVLGDDLIKSLMVAFICFLLSFFSLLVFEKNFSIHGSYTRLSWRLRQSDVFQLFSLYHKVPFDNHISYLVESVHTLYTEVGNGENVESK